jgi:ABC-type bacteriocin/lantibiotic exporter with double-glycine peptidase domain
LQEDTLFAGPIADNIALFDEAAHPEWIVEVGKLAAIHHEIAAMPMGYEMLVGDMGSALSGGQKARVLLARALYRRPRLLLLDEGTAHLDPQTEAAVNQAIASLGITRIVIAHRVQTIRNADRVFVLAGGKLHVLEQIRGASNDKILNLLATAAISLGLIQQGQAQTPPKHEGIWPQSYSGRAAIPQSPCGQKQVTGER